MNKDIIDLSEPVVKPLEVIIDLSEPVAKPFEVPRPASPKHIWQTLRAGLEGMERLDSAERGEVAWVACTNNVRRYLFPLASGVEDGVIVVEEAVGKKSFLEVEPEALNRIEFVEPLPKILDWERDHVDIQKRFSVKKRRQEANVFFWHIRF